jgi:DNA-binding protein
MEATGSSDTSASIYQAARRHISDGRNLVTAVRTSNLVRHRTLENVGVSLICIYI